MEVALVGIGNMGLSWLGAALTAGHKVVAVDKDSRKVTALMDGSLLYGEDPVWAEGLRERIPSHVLATTELEEISGAEIVFIAVQTPCCNATCNYGPLKGLLSSLEKVLRPGQIVLLGSTIFPKAIEEEILPLIPKSVVFAYQPVFLRAGTGVQDYIVPGKTVVGVADPKHPHPALQNFFASVLRDSVVHWCGYRTAEFIKLVHNAFMSVKICFVNEFMRLCEEFDADAEEVIRLTFSEGRGGRLLTQSHMVPGPPYSGTCLPKDAAILHSLLSVRCGGMFPMLTEVSASNNYGVCDTVRKVFAATNKLHPCVGILGVSYRPSYPDIRDSLFLELRARLYDRAEVIGYDPSFEGISKEQFTLLCRQNSELEKLFPEITLRLEEVLEKSDVIVVNRPLSAGERVKVNEHSKPVIDLYRWF